jgi:ABC-type sugar transport system ATPase subunit
MPESIVWEASDVHKAFGATPALSGANLALRVGEIHGLCGENGAGKSTMSKAACGVFPIDSGSFRYDNQSFQPVSLTKAGGRGVTLVFQESMVIPTLTIAENIFIDRLREFQRGGVLSRRELSLAASKNLEAAGADFDVDADWLHLNLGQRKMVEIARALSKEPSVLFVDEATAVLDAAGRELVMAALRRLRDRGVSICYVSHHLDEIFALTDRITVMRDGRDVGTFDTATTNSSDLETLMVGHEVAGSMYPSRHVGVDAPDLLSIETLGDHGPLQDVSLHIRAGEILGIAGLAGCGGSDLLHIIAGDRARHHGHMLMHGAPYSPRSPRHALGMGVALLPGDRDAEGLLGSGSVRENIALASLPRSIQLTHVRNENAVASRFVDTLSIKTSTVEQPVDRLSGGNRQKVVLAKLLATEPLLLLLDNPTRGVDVGARAQIYASIADAARSGMAVLLLSEDLLELIGLSDRILVLREGKVSGTFESTAGLSEQVVLPYML